MPIPTILTSADAGAPVLSGSEGALREVWKWALPQLGWTEEFDDPVNQQVVFRNNPTTGTGDYIKVYDGASDPSVTTHARLESYATMSDINTGTDMVGSTDCYQIKSTDADTDPRDWWIVGDDRSFWWINRNTEDNARYATCNYIGDIHSVNPGDNGVFMIGGNNSLSTSDSSTGAPIEGFSDGVPMGDFCSLRYNSSGLSVGERQECNSWHPDGQASGGFFMCNGNATMEGGGYIVGNLYIRDSSSDRWRGLLRGQVLHNVNLLSSYDTSIGPVELSNRTMPLGNGDLWLMFCSNRIAWSAVQVVLALDVTNDWNDY